MSLVDAPLNECTRNMKFKFLETRQSPPAFGEYTAYLIFDNWNDFSFVTSFYVYVHDGEGILREIGVIKIGFEGQTTDQTTRSTLESEFSQLPEGYFSIGQDVSYYENIAALPDAFKWDFLRSLKDIAHDEGLLEVAIEEPVFKTSLLRSVSLSVIKGQYKRVLRGKPPLTDFEFTFIRNQTERLSSIELDFKVEIGSKPSSNIHAIIGRNGVGKTTILYDMVDAATNIDGSHSSFLEESVFTLNPIENDYFSNLVTVAFSAFDPFSPPKEQHDPSLGTCYHYIGLKNKNGEHKGIRDLQAELMGALEVCFSQKTKKNLWLKSIRTLESDNMFAAKQYSDLEDAPVEYALEYVKGTLSSLSSGHCIIMLTVTELVARVEEKTLVLFDEPESHLHPPLLSSLLRAISNILYDRNAIAIIATHSPVVLQELPKSNVWKIYRTGMSTEPTRPTIETYGENVGILTREVFGLELIKSGFHNTLDKESSAGGSYEEIIREYGNQLGVEARSILQALVTHRDNNTHND